MAKEETASMEKEEAEEQMELSTWRPCAVDQLCRESEFRTQKKKIKRNTESV